MQGSICILQWILLFLRIFWQICTNKSFILDRYYWHLLTANIVFCWLKLTRQTFWWTCKIFMFIISFTTQHLSCMSYFFYYISNKTKVHIYIYLIWNSSVVGTNKIYTLYAMKQHHCHIAWILWGCTMLLLIYYYGRHSVNRQTLHAGHVCIMLGYSVRSYVAQMHQNLNAVARTFYITNKYIKRVL